MTGTEGLQLDDGGRMALAGIGHVIHLVMAVFILFRLDRLAQLVRVDVDRGAIVNEVADARSRRAEPGGQATAHGFGAFGDLLLAFAPLVLRDGVGCRDGIGGVLLGVALGQRTIEAELTLGQLSFQTEIRQFCRRLQRLDLRLASDVCAPAHSFLQHHITS